MCGEKTTETVIHTVRLPKFDESKSLFLLRSKTRSQWVMFGLLLLLPPKFGE